MRERAEWPEIAHYAWAAAEAIDIGILVCDAAFTVVLYANAAARRSVGDVALPPNFAECARVYAASRRATNRLPPAVRIEGSNGVAFFLRVFPSPAPLMHEVVVVREEVVRDGDLFRQLESGYGLSRREFQVLSALRLGKTNRQIAADFGISQNTVAKLVRRLLERFDVPNRTRLADLVERIASKRA